MQNESQMDLPFCRLQESPFIVRLIYQRQGRRIKVTPLLFCSNNQNQSMWQSNLLKIYNDSCNKDYVTSLEATNSGGELL